MRKLIIVAAVFGTFACTKNFAGSSSSGSSNAGTTSGGSGSGTTSSGTTTSTGGSSGSSGSVGGVGLFTRLGGLWNGSATMTPLGDFPQMPMDLRSENNGHLLFGRVDLDDQNALRFGFSIETVNGVDTLIFRNGGLFSGMSRDTRTSLVDFDETAGTYHFCAESTAGCGYVDALFTFSDATHVTLNVHVNGQQHLVWAATREETRDLPSPFPADLSSQGSGTADWPAMPELDVTVSWSPALTADADVWVVLSTTDCNSTTGAGCNASRFMKAAAHAGDTSATLKMVQMHAGDYKANAVLDRNMDFEATLGPDHGDGVALPNRAVTVGATGTTPFAMSIVTSI